MFGVVIGCWLVLVWGCWLIVANWMVFAFVGLGWVVLMCLVLPLRICLVMLGFECSIVIRAGLRCCYCDVLLRGGVCTVVGLFWLCC